MPFIRHPAVLIFALLAICTSAADAGAAPGMPQTPSETDAVVHDLCGKTVALLGESPLHAFGRTLQFKADLVRRLVGECHYNAFFIESGIYDFIDIRKKLESGRETTQPMLAAAIGGLWATREVEPLISFLLEKAKAGSLVLGGLDDQLGRGTYAQRDMPADLVQYLHGDAKQTCLSILRKHTLWQYTSDSPYGPKDKALIVGCLDQIEAAASSARTKDAPYDVVMVASLKRSFARDFPQGVAKDADPVVRDFNDRDRSMYRNFQWLMSRLPAHSKVIVWAATTHVAKALSGVPGQQLRVSLGSYIHSEFRNSSFVLGFSAYSGSYAMARQPVRPLSVAAETSLEGRAFTNDSAGIRYFDSTRLGKLGAIAARPVSSDFKTAKWEEVLDGIVIFHEERPPEFSKE